jgi:hypothetical protein
MIGIQQFAPKRGLAAAVRSLFSNNEQGAWYDPSDLSTLFQDSAGTTPVTAVEQPVGLMLDKRLGGPGTNGAARYNLLTYTEQFDNAAWVNRNANVAVTANATTAPNGTATADKLRASGNVTDSIIGKYQELTKATSAIQYTATVYAKQGEVPYFSGALSFNGGFNGVFARFNLATGVKYVDATAFGTGITNISASISDAGGGWWRIKLSALSDTSSTVRFLITFNKDVNAASTSWTTGEGGYVWGAQLQTGSSATTYQPITADWPSTMAGNHAFQSTSANRPTLSAQVNLLTKTEQFQDTSMWNLVGMLAFGSGSVVDATTAPNGTTTADLLVPNTTSTTHFIDNANATLSFVSGVSYKLSLRVKPNGYNYFRLAFNPAAFPSSSRAAVFNLSGAGVVSAFDSGTTATIQAIANGFYELTLIATANVSASTTFVLGVNDTFVSGTGATTFAGNGTSGVYYWGADLRVSNNGVNIPSYQRVSTSTDYDTVGFPLYLKFNGTSSSMATNSINFTNTDKTTIWSGVRKLSDAANGVIAELSSSLASNTGSFLLRTGSFSTSVGYLFGSRGANNPGTYADVNLPASPVTNVATGIGDIFGDSQILRLNGSQVASNTADQGTGNYGNYPLYVGARAGSSVFFNGQLYSLIIRGAASSAAQIGQAETYVNSKTKAY